MAFGIRQQIDIALKALSPAVNDPYTAVQVIHRLTTVCCDLIVRPLGSEILTHPSGRGLVIVPGNTFGDYLSFICNRLARYGGTYITVMTALLRLVRSCVEVARDECGSVGHAGSRGDRAVGQCRTDDAVSG